MNCKKLTKSSGNIFADLGFSDAEGRLLKTDLAIQINGIIKIKKITQKEIADLLSIDQKKVLDLAHGILVDFSIECLQRFLFILSQDVGCN